MRAPVSAIVPTLDAASIIGPTLAALAEGAVDGLIREVVIVEGGTDQSIEDIAEAAGARLARTAPGRGGQMAAGAALASAPWLLFLHADSVPGPGWQQSVRRHIETSPDRAGWFHLAFDERSTPARLVAGWANLRSQFFALPYGDQGLLIRAALYRQLGGHPPIPLMEDVALSRRLGRGRLAPLGATMMTSAARYRHQGWLARGTRNLTTLALYQAGVPPARLVARYRGRQ